MKNKAITRSARSDLINYIIICAAFILITVLKNNGALSRSQQGLLVPICCYIVMAISLNLVVGILGDLSLGHAGFMSVGAFTGVITAMSLASAIPSAPLRLALAMVVGAFFVGQSAFAQLTTREEVQVDDEFVLLGGLCRVGRRSNG